MTGRVTVLGVTCAFALAWWPILALITSPDLFGLCLAAGLLSFGFPLLYLLSVVGRLETRAASPVSDPQPVELVAALQDDKPIASERPHRTLWVCSAEYTTKPGRWWSQSRYAVCLVWHPYDWFGEIQDNDDAYSVEARSERRNRALARDAVLEAVGSIASQHMVVPYGTPITRVAVSEDQKVWQICDKHLAS